MVNSVQSRLLALLVLALAAYGIERLIVTDTEAIENLAAAMAEDIKDQRWEALESHLHEDFTYGTRGRRKTIAHIRSLVGKYRPTGVGVSLYEIKVDGDDATALGEVWGHVAARPVRVGIQVKLTRTEEGDWVLLEVSGGEHAR
jgi:hypothetical protein